MYVFDTDVLVAAFRSRNGASFLILEALGRGEIEGAASEALLLEYRDVLARDSHTQHFWMSEKEVDAVISVLAARLRPVPIRFIWRPQLRDPDDELVLECAINAQAEGVVTFNAKDFLPAAGRFGIEVIRPGEFVKREGLLARKMP